MSTDKVESNPWKALMTFKNLFKKTLCGKRIRSKRDQQLLWSLQTRALFINMFFSFMRISQMVLSDGAWFAEQHHCSEKFEKDCLGDYNHAIMDPIEPYARYALKMIVIVTALLNIACIKWRGIANCFIYLECLTRIVATLIPNYANYEYTLIGWAMLFAFFFFCFYCDHGMQIICTTLTIAFHIFYDMAAYNRVISASTIVLSVAIVFGFLITQTICGMVIVHVSQVHEKLHYTNEENMKLLNGMHEGVLILKQAPDEPMTAIFCNRPAQKLINTFLGGIKTNEDKDDKKKENFTQFLTKLEFKPL